MPHTALRGLNGTAFHREQDKASSESAHHLKRHIPRSGVSCNIRRQTTLRASFLVTVLRWFTQHAKANSHSQHDSESLSSDVSRNMTKQTHTQRITPSHEPPRPVKVKAVVHPAVNFAGQTPIKAVESAVNAAAHSAVTDPTPRGKATPPSSVQKLTVLYRRQRRLQM